MLRRLLPDMPLAATDGGQINPARIPGRAVYFIYPYTGRPGVPDPEGWDQIPGAHGSTPQALAYSWLCDAFLALGVKVFGVSMQSSDWQRDFVDRNALRLPLLSDEGRQFSSAMALEAFHAGDREFLRRRTFVSENGVVIHDRRDVVPATDAEDVLVWLKANP